MTTLQKALAFAIIVVVVLHFVGDLEPGERNFEIMPEMFFSVPYGPFDPNPNFEDGKTARDPVAGTIAFGHPPLASKGLLLDTKTEWKELGADQQAAWDAFAAPKPDSDAKPGGGGLARGRAVFATVCTGCHGPGGAGDGKSTKRGVPPPPSLAAEGASKMSDGHLFRIITAGQGNMASHAVQVPRAERWRVVRFIRSLQGSSSGGTKGGK